MWWLVCGVRESRPQEQAQLFHVMNINFGVKWSPHLILASLMDCLTLPEPDSYCFIIRRNLVGSIERQCICLCYTVGLVVEYSPATGETRVRFPDGVHRPFLLLRIPFFWSKPVMQLRFYLHFHICPSCPDIQKILFSINDCCFTVSLSFYLHSDFLCSISFYFFHKSQVTLFRSISCFPLEVVFHFVVEEKRGCSVNFRTKCEGFVKSR